jgi:trimethylamine--corrinoid protein Co-methyltransferase
MVKGGIEGGKYRLLSNEEIKMIHKTSLKILQQTGIKSENEEILTHFSKIGAEVDFEKGIIRFSPALVEDAIDKAPSKILLCGREEKNDLTLEGKKVYCGTGGAALNVLDLETGERRESQLKDIADIAKLVDALDNIHFYLRPVVARDISSVESALEVISMAEEIAGGKEKLRNRPIISFITSFIKSPLQLADPTKRKIKKQAYYFFYYFIYKKSFTIS